MKLYKAIVKDMDGNIKIIQSEYPNKSAFIHDLRRNGYKVNPKKVKEASEFDRILDKTNAHLWDWE